MFRSFFLGTWPLFIGLFCIIVGNSIQGSLIAYRAGAESYSPLLSGLIISGYYIGMLASVFTTPHFLKTVGHVRLFAALTALVSSTILAFPLIVHPVAWLFFRLLLGFGYVGLFIITEVWINALTENSVRGRITSFYMFIQFFGFITGQLMLRSETSESINLFLFASIGVSIAVIPMLMVHVKVPAQPESSRTMPLKELYKLSPFAGVGTFLVTMNQTVFYATLGFFAHFIGMNLKQLSIMTILVFIAAMISQWPMAWLSDRIDRRLVIMLGSGVAFFLALFGLGIDLNNLQAVYFIIFALALAIMPLYSVNLAHANDVVPANKIVAVNATMYLLTAFGSMTGPIAMSSFMAKYAADGFFLFIASGNILLLSYALYRRSVRSVTIHYKSSIVPLTPLQTNIIDPLQTNEELAEKWDISKNETPDYHRTHFIRNFISNLWQNTAKKLNIRKKNNPDAQHSHFMGELMDNLWQKWKKIHNIKQAKDATPVTPTKAAETPTKTTKTPTPKSAPKKQTPKKPSSSLDKKT